MILSKGACQLFAQQLRLLANSNDSGDADRWLELLVLRAFGCIIRELRVARGIRRGGNDLSSLRCS